MRQVERLGMVTNTGGSGYRRAGGADVDEIRAICKSLVKQFCWEVQQQELVAAGVFFILGLR